MVDLNFPYPGTVGAIGMVGTSIITFTAVRVLRLVPTTQRVSTKFFAAQILPTGLFLALSMQLGNTAYLHLSGEDGYSSGSFSTRDRPGAMLQHNQSAVPACAMIASSSINEQSLSISCSCRSRGLNRLACKSIVPQLLSFFGTCAFIVAQLSTDPTDKHHSQP